MGSVRAEAAPLGKGVFSVALDQLLSLYFLIYHQVSQFSFTLKKVFCFFNLFYSNKNADSVILSAGAYDVSLPDIQLQYQFPQIRLSLAG